MNLMKAQVIAACTPKLGQQLFEIIRDADYRASLLDNN